MLLSEIGFIWLESIRRCRQGVLHRCACICVCVHHTPWVGINFNLRFSSCTTLSVLRNTSSLRFLFLPHGSSQWRLQPPSRYLILSSIQLIQLWSVLHLIKKFVVAVKMDHFRYFLMQLHQIFLYKSNKIWKDSVVATSLKIIAQFCSNHQLHH